VDRQGKAVRGSGVSRIFSTYNETGVTYDGYVSLNSWARSGGDAPFSGTARWLCWIYSLGNPLLTETRECHVEIPEAGR
jgi:hypothetical protein